MMKTLLAYLQWTTVAWRLVALLLLATGPAWAQIAPANDDCTQAAPVPVLANCVMPVNGTVGGATQSAPPTANCGFNTFTANDVWYSFVAGSASQYITLAPRFAAILDVRSGTCANSSSVFCANIFSGNINSTLVPGLTAGQTYFIRVYASGNVPPVGISSTFALCVSPGPVTSVPANDDCAGAIDVPVQSSGLCGTPVPGDNTNATASAGVPAPGCASYQTADIWYKVTVPAGGNVTVQTVASGTVNDVGDTGMALYSGTCAGLTLLDCDDDGGGSFKSLINVSGRTPGEVLYVRVWGFAGRTGTFGLCAITSVAPANDDCAGAIPLAVGATCTPTPGSIGTASQSLPPTAGCGFSASASDVWYSFVASGTTQSITFMGQFAAVLDVRSGTCASSASVFCTTAFNGQPQTVGGLTMGQTYFLRLYANNNLPPGSGQFTLCVTPGPVPPANDDCAGAVAIPVTPGCTSPLSTSIAVASQSLPPTAGCGLAGQQAANDVWYSFVASGATQSITFTGQFTAVLDVRTGTCATSSSLYCNTAFSNQAQTVGGLTAGQAYFLRIYPNGNFTPTVPGFTLCVTPGPVPPVNDDCAGAVALPVTTGCTAPASGTFVGASQSQPPTASCGFAPVARDVWYSFVANGPTQTITVNASFGTVVDVRSGTCASSASVFCTTTFSNQGAVVSGLTSGQTYFLRLYPNSNVQPTPANGALTVCVSDGPPPAINDDCAQAIPISVVQTCTNSTNGTVANASQSLPPTAGCGTATVARDVWYSFVASASVQVVTLTARFAAVLDVRSGTCVSSASLLCNAVPANSTGGTLVNGLTAGQTYFVRVYTNNNTTPPAAGATFTICITPAPTPPANDDCATAIGLPVTATCQPTAGTVLAASQSLPGTAGCAPGNYPTNDVWYSFVASGVAHSITVAAGTQLALDVRTGSCTASTSIFCATVFGTAGNTQLVGGLTSGQTYYIRLYSAAFNPPTGAQAAFTICVTPAPTPPANDDCAGAIDVPIQFGAACVTQTGGSNVAATGSSGVPTPTCAGYQGADIWFKVTVPASGTLTVRTLAPSAGNDVGDTGMSIYSGTCTGLTQVGCNDDGGGNLKSLLALTGRTPGEVLYIRVWGFGGNARGNFAVCATAPSNCQPPFSLNSSNVTANTATLDWQAGGPVVPGVSYTVEYGPQGFALGTGTVLASLPATSATLNNLQAGTRYCFYVRQACGGVAGGNSAYAGPECFSTPNIAPCAAPTMLATAGVTATTADVSWQAGAPGAGVSYTVEYGPVGFLPGTGTVRPGLTGLSTQLTGLTPGADYCVYVRQSCPGGTGSSNYAGPQCFTMLTAATCPAPTALAVANITASTVDLSWLAGGTPTPGTTYTVEYGLQGFVPGTGTLVAALSTPSLPLTNLVANTAYCYYVRQSCAGGGNSPAAGPRCFTTAPNTSPCPAPSSLAAASVTASAASLSWQPASAPPIGTTYSVEYGPQGFTLGTGTVVAGLSSPTLALTLLAPNTTYCFYVRQLCGGAAGTSNYAGPQCFSTQAATPVPVNDEPCGAVPLLLATASGPGQSVLSTNVGATTSTQPGIGTPTCAPNPAPRDVWFSLVPAAGTTTVVLRLSGAAAGLVRVFTAPSCATGPFTLVACQSSGAPNTGLASVTLNGLTAGRTYYVAVSGYGPADTPGSFSLEGDNGPLATRPLADTNALLLYPNPSSTGQLTLQAQLPARGQATLLNAIGQVVLTFDVPASTKEQVLSTTGLATGVYTLRVVAGPQVLTRKVVLE